MHTYHSVTLIKGTMQVSTTCGDSNLLICIPVKKYSPYLTVNQVIRKVHCRCALKETVSFVICKTCSLKKEKKYFYI